jgi:CarD family transcriptional regulator
MLHNRNGFGGKMFAIGDKVLYPLYGAGIIENIEEKEILGKKQSYYQMRILISDMYVLIPVSAGPNVGLRFVVDSKTSKEVLDNFAGMDIEQSTNWNKRYRDNMLILKSGCIEEVAGVVRSLMARDFELGLSTGEMKMLLSAKQVLLSEIMLSANIPIKEIESQLNEAFRVKPAI